MDLLLVGYGTIGKRVAHFLSSWVPLIFENKINVLAPENIPLEKDGFKKICHLLDEIDFGVICLTSDNLTNSLVNFEAGALYRKNMFTLLCDLISKDFDNSEPLYYYEHAMFTKNGIKELITQINRSLPENQTLSEKTIDESFNKNWKILELGFTQIRELIYFCDEIQHMIHQGKDSPLLTYKQFLTAYLPYVPEWTKLIIVSRTPVIFFEREADATYEKQLWYDGLKQRIIYDKKYPTDFFISRWHLMKYLKENDKERENILRNWVKTYKDATEPNHNCEIYVVNQERFPSISLIYAEQIKSSSPIMQYYLMIQFREDMYVVDESMEVFDIIEKGNPDSEYWICHKECSTDNASTSEWRKTVNELILGKLGVRRRYFGASVRFGEFAKEMCSIFQIEESNIFI